GPIVYEIANTDSVEDDESEGSTSGEAVPEDVDAEQETKSVDDTESEEGVPDLDELAPTTLIDLLP
ncbi:hypothetical protein U1Q18_036332, partial [Sarracenia purpurea var. burkii]